jgi:hypothetical protein
MGKSKLNDHHVVLIIKSILDVKGNHCIILDINNQHIIHLNIEQLKYFI